MARVTLIELEIPQGRKKFAIEDADMLLRMKFNGGWKLPEDSEWTWCAERGFEKKAKGKGGASAAAPDKGSEGEKD